MRINARLEEKDEKKMQYLLDHTGDNVTNVIREAVAMYYTKVKSKDPKGAHIFQDVGFIASGEGDKNLSSNYKKELKKTFGKNK